MEITGEILLRYNIDAVLEIQRLKELLHDVSNNGNKRSVTSFLTFYKATSISDVFNRIDQQILDPEIKMLHLIRVFLDLGDVALNISYSVDFFKLRLTYYLDVIDKLNYTYKKNEYDKFILHKKDALVELVSNSITDVAIKWRIYEFNMLGSTLSDKIDSLRDFYAHFETLGLRRMMPTLDEAMRFLNVLRHGDYKQDPILLERFTNQNTKNKYLELCFDLVLRAFLEISLNKSKKELNV